MIAGLLLAAVMSTVDGASAPPAPVTLAPAVTISRAAPAKAVPGHQVQGPDASVDTLDGFTAVTGASTAAGTDAVHTVAGYSARLDQQLCDIKPWYCQ